MKKINKINGLKKAVGDYQRANSGGSYSPWYGCLMYDKSDRSVWVDTFYSLGHNEWKEYHSTNIVNLGRLMSEQGIPVNMKNVRDFVEKYFG